MRSKVRWVESWESCWTSARITKWIWKPKCFFSNHTQHGSNLPSQIHPEHIDPCYGNCNTFFMTLSLKIIQKVQWVQTVAAQLLLKAFSVHTGCWCVSEFNLRCWYLSTEDCFKTSTPSVVEQSCRGVRKALLFLRKDRRLNCSEGRLVCFCVFTVLIFCNCGLNILLTTQMPLLRR